MIDNTALLRARVKMFKAKKVATTLEKSKSPPTAGGGERRAKVASPAFRQYSAQAREILRDVSELRDLVLDKRKEYILCSGSMVAYSFTTIMSEADRRRFDTDSDTAVKQCSKLVHFFDTQITSDRSLRRDDELPHLKMVSQLLSVYLKEVCGLIEQLRTIYRKKSEHLRKICRLANLVEKYERSIDDARRVDRALADEQQRREREMGGGSEEEEEVNERDSSSSAKSARRRRSPISDEPTNRSALQLDASQQKVRVYDFTSDAPKTRLKAPCNGKTDAISDGWSELEDDPLLPSVTDGCQPTAIKTRSDVGESDAATVAASSNNDGGFDGWTDAELDFPIDEKSPQDHDSDRASNKAPQAEKKKTGKEVGFGRLKSDEVNANGPVKHEATNDENRVDSPPIMEELSRNEQEQLVVENRKLFDKFAHSDEDILHIGRQLSEIQRLQNTFAEKVTEQEHDIDHIHTQTIYTLDNLDAANQFIREAIKNTASRRVIVLFCLLVLTFTLLFLDWYNP